MVSDEGGEAVAAIDARQMSRGRLGGVRQSPPQALSSPYSAVKGKSQFTECTILVVVKSPSAEF